MSSETKMSVARAPRVPSCCLCHTAAFVSVQLLAFFLYRFAASSFGASSMMTASKADGLLTTAPVTLSGIVCSASVNLLQTSYYSVAAGFAASAGRGLPTLSWVSFVWEPSQ